MAKQCKPLDVGAGVNHLRSASLPHRQRERKCHCGLHRAAPAKSAAAIVDTRDETLLQRVGDVGAIRERRVPPSSL